MPNLQCFYLMFFTTVSRKSFLENWTFLTAFTFIFSSDSNNQKVTASSCSSVFSLLWRVKCSKTWSSVRISIYPGFSFFCANLQKQLHEHDACSFIYIIIIVHIYNSSAFFVHKVLYSHYQQLWEVSVTFCFVVCLNRLDSLALTLNTSLLFVLINIFSRLSRTEHKDVSENSGRLCLILYFQN